MSYVLVTSAVVALAGAVFILLLAPRLLAAADSGARVRTTATRDAETLTRIATRLGRLPNAGELRTQLGRLAPGDDNPVCDRTARIGPGQATATGDGVAIPCVEGALGNAKPMSLMLLVAADGKVVASSYPRRFPVGARAAGVVAVESVGDLNRGAAAGGVGGRTLQGGVLWALQPVQLAGGGGTAGRRLGLVATRRLRRRLRRLASTATGVAWGDLEQRVTISGQDEIGEIEDGVNRLIEWLSTELEAGKGRSKGAAADAERSQFVREVHESVLRDLSSL